MRIYRFSSTGFSLQHQKAWVRYLEDLKHLQSRSYPSIFYWIKQRITYKIKFNHLMLYKALNSYSFYKDSTVSSIPYNKNQTGEEVLANLHPDIDNHQYGVWVFLKKPDTSMMNRHCFSYHAKADLYGADIEENTLAYEVYGNGKTYKKIKDHFKAGVFAVYIPHAQVTNEEKIDKNRENCNYYFSDNYGFLRSFK